MLDIFIKILLFTILFSIGLLSYNQINYPLPEHGGILSKKGNLMWYNRPALSATKDKVYTGWMTSDRRVVVGEIERSSGKLINEVYLHQWRYLDDHGAPIVHVIKEGEHKGKLISIYNLHNSDIYFQRSINSSDILRWEAKKVISKCACTYPTLLEINQVLYLFYRKEVDDKLATRAYFMKTSDDYGDTWREEKEIIEPSSGKWIYAMVSGSDTEGLHIAWGVYSPEFDDVQNIYYAHSNDNGVNWASIKTKRKSNKLESTLEYLVRSSPNEMASRVWDFRTDGSGNPVLLAVDYNKDNVLAYWMRYTGKQWDTVNLGENSYQYYPCGLVFKGGYYNRIYMAKDQPGGISSIYEIVINSETNSWVNEHHIENKSKFSHCRPLSGSLYPGLIFTAVKSYENFMDFDTWLIVMKNY